MYEYCTVVVFQSPADLTSVSKVLLEGRVGSDPEVDLLSGLGGGVGEAAENEEAQQVAANDVEQVRHAVLRERRLVLVLPPEVVERTDELLHQVKSGGERVPGAAELLGCAFQRTLKVNCAILRLRVEGSIAAQFVPKLALLSQRQDAWMKK